jgi:hypothetical protein
MNQEPSDLKVFFLPCTCGHPVEEHEAIGWGNLVGECKHDKAFFKGMCSCGFYRAMTNLEYLEWLYEKSSKVH